MPPALPCSNQLRKWASDPRSLRGASHTQPAGQLPLTHPAGLSCVERHRKNHRTAPRIRGRCGEKVLGPRQQSLPAQSALLRREYAHSRRRLLEKPANRDAGLLPLAARSMRALSCRRSRSVARIRCEFPFWLLLGRELRSVADEVAVLVEIRRHGHVEESHHHLVVGLLAPAYGGIRVRVVRIVAGVVIPSDGLQLRACLEQPRYGETVAHLPVEMIMDVEQRFNFLVRSSTGIPCVMDDVVLEALSAQVHVRK